MTTLEEGRHAAEFVMGEDNGHRSRDNVEIVESSAITPGTVLGRVGEARGAANASVGAISGTGDGVLTLANPKTVADVKPGGWKVECIEPGANVGTFNVIDPDGELDGVAKVGVAYTGSIKFTIADGSADFVAGDTFPVAVTRADPAAVGQFAAWDPTADDGSEEAAAIALYGVTTGEGATANIAAITRGAEINGKLLEWPDGVSADDKAAAITSLATRGIIVR